MSNNVKTRLGDLRSGTLKLSMAKKPAVCMKIITGMSKNFDVLEMEIERLEKENAEYQSKIETLIKLLPDDVAAVLE